jgi:hypothetical protein
MNLKPCEVLFVSLLLLAHTSHGQSRETFEQFEARHTAAISNFETETRAELTSIARDEALSGEDKIIRIEGWFAKNAQRIADINAMADVLDEGKPLSRPAPAPRQVAQGAGELVAAALHGLSRSLAMGEITPAEFDRLREPLLDRLSSISPPLKSAPQRLPVPPIPEEPISAHSPEELARAWHAQNRYLACLPHDETSAIRADRDSLVNRLLAAMQAEGAPAGEQAPQDIPTNRTKE